MLDASVQISTYLYKQLTAEWFLLSDMNLKNLRLKLRYSLCPNHSAVLLI